MTEDTPSFILTASQELQLLSDQEVGSMLHLFAEQTEDQYNYSAIDNTLVDDSSHSKIFIEKFEPESGVPFPSPELPIAPAQPSIIINEDYPGPYDFEISLKPQAGNNTWVYSEKLNKIYTLISQSIPIDFKWKAPMESMYVRATPLYSALQYAQTMVKRCLLHCSPLEPSNLNIPNGLYDHVLRCQDSNAYYYGSVEANTFLNVIVPLGQPQVGTEFVRVMYSFVCNNSCPSGMNRKALEVVFTLEDQDGKVFGRKKVHVRVCSCPKRDKEKEEKDYVKHSLKGKKFVRSEKKQYSSNSSLDTKKYDLNVNICGKENQKFGVRMIHQMITIQSLENSSNAELKLNKEYLRAYLKSLD
ncbi:hypothetical protein RN001_005414 [Aquatica leii]|uniref:p53 DNA-binding domain-containing protein n=1 Tax=Aquatica leii TaxID=1421715 RepID=A0AAN7Q6X6_9COLE|nr:hypothetical protein RN001_005414 [Aquatica leii]